jgi:hypothetical protein
MSSIVIAGDTSGSVTLQAPATAGTTVLTLPSTTGTIVTASGTATAGGVAYGNGTTAAYSAAGTSGQFLQSNGASAPTFATVSAGFTLGTPVASTSGTSITFTGIPSGVKQVVISFLNWSTTGNENRQIQLGDSGGIETSGYKSAGLSIVNPGPTTALSGYSDAFMVKGTTAVQQLNGSVILTMENSTNNTWVAQGILTDQTSEYGMFFVGGSKSLSAVLTQIRIQTESTTTFDGGEINIAYI